LSYRQKQGHTGAKPEATFIINAKEKIMGVVALYYSDRDDMKKAMEEGNVFSTAKEAQERDRFLELVDEARDFLVRKVEGLDEDTADRVAMVIAENRELFKKGMTKPSVLGEKNAEIAKEEAEKKKPAAKRGPKKKEPIQV
jgi:dsDNA-binding SOS-regulon protein